MLVGKDLLKFVVLLFLPFTTVLPVLEVQGAGIESTMRRCPRSFGLPGHTEDVVVSPFRALCPKQLLSRYSRSLAGDL